MISMKHLLFFVHYNKYAGLSGHVPYLLEHVKHIFDRVVFVSNSPLTDNQRTKIAPLCDEVIVRDNRGFDFGAWKDLIIREGRGNLSQYHSLTLMNDSCFGPLFNLDNIYEKMEQRGVDFWGITNHKYANHGMPGSGKPIPEHIQSYFICFNNRVIISRVFQEFWAKIEYETDMELVIQRYETKLIKILNQSGFKHAVFFDGSDFQDKEPNLLVRRPDLCLNNGVPFIKIKAFLNFPIPKHLISLIREKTDYPVSLIYDYFTDMYDPNTSLLIGDKLVPARLKGKIFSSPLKIALHLHVFYTDVFTKYVSYFDTYSVYFDLFFTTDTSDKKKYIEEYIRRHECSKKLKEIIIIENKGRDIFPWLSIKDRLKNYDVVGHFHTKKSIHSEEYNSIIWLQELFDLLLFPIEKIIEAFSVNEKIGIIIPEIPFIFHFIFPLKFYQETNMKIAMNKIWKKMKCKKTIDFEKLLTAIMPVGTMFWYRPAALAPLFQLRLLSDDFPKEPIPNDGTILHCIERLLVYAAWNEDYDYRIMVPETPHGSLFADNMLLNQYRRQYDRLRKSTTFRVGRLVLLVPRSLKVLFRLFRRVIKKMYFNLRS
jgi:rhamnosyltransferase